MLTVIDNKLSKLNNSEFRFLLKNEYIYLKNEYIY